MENRMANTLIWVCDSFSTAEGAREALLASGFSLSNVHLESKEDEAGPMEGNFIFDCKDARKSTSYSFFGASSGKGERDKLTPYEVIVQRGTYLLTVDTDGEEEFARASDIMKLFEDADEDQRVSSRESKE
jgi:hypothetical protein